MLSAEPQKAPRDMSSAPRSIRVDAALWANSMCPEGILERWRVAEGAEVAAGDVLAELRIEGALHEITAPAAGTVTSCAMVNDIVEPGSPLCTLEGA